MSQPHRPVVTAEYSRPFEREEIRTHAGIAGRYSTPGVELRIDFDLHDHAAALALLDEAVANVKAQIEETR